MSINDCDLQDITDFLAFYRDGDFESLATKLADQAVYGLRLEDGPECVAGPIDGAKNIIATLQGINKALTLTQFEVTNVRPYPGGDPTRFCATVDFNYEHKTRAVNWGGTMQLDVWIVDGLIEQIFERHDPAGLKAFLALVSPELGLAGADAARKNATEPTETVPTLPIDAPQPAV